MGITYGGKGGETGVLAFVGTDHATGLNARRQDREGLSCWLSSWFTGFEDAASDDTINHGIRTYGHERGCQRSDIYTPSAGVYEGMDGGILPDL